MYPLGFPFIPFVSEERVKVYDKDEKLSMSFLFIFMCLISIASSFLFECSDIVCAYTFEHASSSAYIYQLHVVLWWHSIWVLWHIVFIRVFLSSSSSIISMSFLLHPTHNWQRFAEKILLFSVACFPLSRLP